MIVSSKGLDAIVSDRHYYSLYKLLAQAFQDVDASGIISSMTGMDQYFLFYRGQPVAVVSIRGKGGFLRCSGGYYNNVLYNVSTASNHRRKGYMERLLKHVIHVCRKQKKRHLNLEVLRDNTPSINLYKKLGFQVVDDCGGILMMRLYLLRKKNHSCS